MVTIATLNDLFFRGYAPVDRPDAMWRKQDGVFRPIPSGDLVRDVEAIACGLIGAGIQRGDRVALLSENRPEWIVADFAILTAGAVTVPIPVDLPAAHLRHILTDSGARALFCSTPARLAPVLPLRPDLPRLGEIVLFDPPAAAGASLPEGVLSLAEFRAAGLRHKAAAPDAHPTRAAEIGPDDLATLVYTSGTTGMPKGVLLTHGALAGNARAICELVEVERGDLALSFLPLSHLLERIVHFAGLLKGGAVAYAESYETLAQDMLLVRPTVIAGVPRFYEKLHERIRQSLARVTGLRRRILDWACGVGAEHARARMAGGEIPRGLDWRFAAAYALALSKVHARLGGRVRLLLSGGAALSPAVAEFFAGLGFTLLEGYGLTETAPVVALNRPGAMRFGTGGKPLPGVDVRFAADGEILVRGPNLMRGYHNLPAETAEVLHDGWFSTGDIGRFDADGFLVITDRKKDLIKTSTGKWVAPAPLEARLRDSPYIASAVVVGNNRRFVSALLVPNREECAAAAAAGGGAGVRELLQREVDRVNAGLPGHETIKRFAVLEREFSPATGELTHTLKVRRKAVEELYAAALDALYRDGEGS